MSFKASILALCQLGLYGLKNKLINAHYLDFGKLMNLNGRLRVKAKQKVLVSSDLTVTLLLCTMMKTFLKLSMSYLIKDTAGEQTPCLSALEPQLWLRSFPSSSYDILRNKFNEFYHTSIYGLFFYLRIKTCPDLDIQIFF